MINRRMKTETTIEATMAAVGQKTTIAGAGTTGIGYLASSEFLGLAGLAVAVAGLLVNLYFRWKEDRRQQLKHEAEMAAIRGGMHGNR